MQVIVIDGQNATMCLSVLNWINDLLVSMFLGGHRQKKKKKKVLYLLWILAKLLIVWFCFF